MKAYLGTTATLFALLAAAHVMRTISEWSRFRADPWGFMVEAPGIGLLAAVLSIWGWRLFARDRRTLA
jgi:hypothetical protein